MLKHDDDRKDAIFLEPEAPATAAGEKYPVGYGRPPAQGRFKAGCSGNPQGRPKGSRNAKTVVSQVVNEKVSVRENAQGDEARSHAAERCPQSHERRYPRAQCHIGRHGQDRSVGRDGK